MHLGNVAGDAAGVLVVENGQLQHSLEPQLRAGSRIRRQPALRDQQIDQIHQFVRMTQLRLVGHSMQHAASQPAAELDPLDVAAQPIQVVGQSRRQDEAGAAQVRGLLVRRQQRRRVGRGVAEHPGVFTAAAGLRV